jgi:hypothetical protein
MILKYIFLMIGTFIVIESIINLNLKTNINKTKLLLIDYFHTFSSKKIKDKLKQKKQIQISFLLLINCLLLFLKIIIIFCILYFILYFFNISIEQGLVIFKDFKVVILTTIYSILYIYIRCKIKKIILF